MGRTAHRVLEAGSIAVLLALTVVAGVVAPVEADGITPSSAPPLASPAPSVERTAWAAVIDELGVRGAIQLIVLALTCSAAVACYSASGEHGGTRVPARVRRR